jgi:hypothetical protein
VVIAEIPVLNAIIELILLILYGYVRIVIDNMMENVVFAEEEDQLRELLVQVKSVTLAIN